MAQFVCKNTAASYNKTRQDETRPRFSENRYSERRGGVAGFCYRAKPLPALTLKITATEPIHHALWCNQNTVGIRTLQSFKL